jgi:hypothetical protein
MIKKSLYIGVVALFFFLQLNALAETPCTQAGQENLQNLMICVGATRRAAAMDAHHHQLMASFARDVPAAPPIYTHSDLDTMLLYSSLAAFHNRNYGYSTAYLMYPYSWPW